MRKIASLASVFFILSFLSVNVSRAADVPPDDLPAFVAQEIFKGQVSGGGKSMEGVLIAHVEHVKFPVKEVAPVSVWKCDNGALIPGDKDALIKAVKSRDRSNWPNFVFLFSFRSAGNDEAVADVCTMYNRGISPKSRGGNMAVWTLRRKDGSWAAEKKARRIMWD